MSVSALHSSILKPAIIYISQSCYSSSSPIRPKHVPPPPWQYQNPFHNRGPSPSLHILHPITITQTHHALIQFPRDHRSSFPKVQPIQRGTLSPFTFTQHHACTHTHGQPSDLHFSRRLMPFCSRPGCLRMPGRRGRMIGRWRRSSRRRSSTKRV